MEQGNKQVKRSYEEMEGELMKTGAPIQEIRVKN